MVKGKLAVENDWTMFFKEMEATGRGGVLASLAAGIIGSIWPSAAPIANAVATVVPF